MKKIITVLSIVTTSSALLFTACKKDDNNPAPGHIELHFDNVVGADELNMGSTWYVNANGDTFQVTKMNYYISNIVLNGPNGNSYTEPESYHLVQESEPSSQEVELENVPSGEYTSVTFMIGVDSVHNVSGAQTGALDPANGMFWSWNTGYIMAKFEGVSPQSTAAGNILVYHVGGFTGTNNVLKTVTLPFPQSVNLNNNGFHIHINADLLKWFTPNIINFGTLNTIHMPGADAKNISDNYAHMFSVEAVETL